MRVVKAPALEAVDGGPDYYGRFANISGTSRPYFPIAGLARGRHRPRRPYLEDKAAGINTYVAFGRRTTASSGEIRDEGLAARSSRVRNSVARAETAGWEIPTRSTCR